MGFFSNKGITTREEVAKVEVVEKAFPSGIYDAEIKWIFLKSGFDKDLQVPTKELYLFANVEIFNGSESKREDFSLGRIIDKNDMMLGADGAEPDLNKSVEKAEAFMNAIGLKLASQSKIYVPSSDGTPELDNEGKVVYRDAKEFDATPFTRKIGNFDAAGFDLTNVEGEKLKVFLKKYSAKTKDYNKIGGVMDIHGNNADGKDQTAEIKKVIEKVDGAWEHRTSTRSSNGGGAKDSGVTDGKQASSSAEELLRQLGDR